MEQLLSFLSNLMIFTGGLVVVVFWVVIIIVVSVEVYDAIFDKGESDAEDTLR